MRMRQIVIFGLFGSTIWFHIIFLKKALLSEKKALAHKMCVLISLQILSEAFLILRRTEPDMTNYVYW
jgi:hypothetical protein